MHRLASTRTRIALIAVLIALGGGGAALAATQSSSPSASSARQTFLRDMARRLGVPPSKLEAAIRGSLLDRLDEALADGRLSARRAAVLRRRIERGTWAFAPSRAFGRAPTARGLIGPAATYLSISRSQLMSELRSGESLATVAGTHQRSIAGLKQALRDAEKARLGTAESRGLITSAREQRLLRSLAARVDRLVERRFRFRPRLGGLPLFSPTG